MQFRTARTIVIANFIIFVALTFALGGDAINGKREAGRYFLGSHGHYTEVSHGIYVYSYTHTLLTMLAMFIYAAAAWAFRRDKDAGI